MNAVGPDRERADLSHVEDDTFTLIVEFHTMPQERFQLSYALRQVQRTQSIWVQDGFQRNARKMWRTVLPDNAL